MNLLLVFLLTFSLILNIIFIPRYGYIAASITTLVSERIFLNTTESTTNRERSYTRSVEEFLMVRTCVIQFINLSRTL